MQTYAIGDIHGHIGLLHGAHDLIEKDRAAYGDVSAPVVHVGDLVDRGPDSRGVVEVLQTGMAEGRNWLVLKGNHDRMLAGFLSDISYHDAGLRGDLSYLNPRIGGGATRAAYGVRAAADRPLAPVFAEAVAAVPLLHRRFLEALPSQFQRGEVLFVHAGIRPGVAFADQTETDLVWIRAGFLEDTRDFGALIVHGHTALDAARNYGNRVTIDSGAAYGGPLTAVVIEGRKVWTLTDEGRVPLLPQS